MNREAVDRTLADVETRVRRIEAALPQSVRTSREARATVAPWAPTAVSQCVPGAARVGTPTPTVVLPEEGSTTVSTLVSSRYRSTRSPAANPATVVTTVVPGMATAREAATVGTPVDAE